MPSLFTELRRRNVFKVGAAYAIVAWLLIEVASVLLPTFNAPEWIMQVFTLFVILGFPLALILAWAFDLTPQGIKAASDVQSGSAPAQMGGQRLSYIFQGLVFLAVGFLVVDQYVLEPTISIVAVPETANSTSLPAFAQVRRFATNLGSTERMGNTGLSAQIALSPDGQRLVYAAQIEGKAQLYIRELDELEVRPMPGTDGANHPFFSPDGEWVVFYSDLTDAKLKKVSVRGGPPQVLADAPLASGGTWANDDTIVFATQDPAGSRTLFRISASGGPPEALITSDPNAGHVWPDVLPGGNAILFVIRPGFGGVGNAREGQIVVLTLETGEYETLIAGGYRPRYAPTGHIVFVRGESLWAVPFDAERLEKTGPEVPVLVGVEQDGFIGGAAFAFSDDGMLVYVPGGDTTLIQSNRRSLVWVDREGREEPLAVEPSSYLYPRISPDDQHVALSINRDGNWDVWILDLLGETSSRLTFDPGLDARPLWTPNGERVVFSSTREGGGLFWKAVDGTGQAERLTTKPVPQRPYSFSPDGTQLVFAEVGQQWDLHVLSLENEFTSRPLLQTAFGDRSPAISPDGRWLAYHSNESGRNEVYVRPFPNVEGGKWEISRDGGEQPRWGPDGSDLFYRTVQGIMVASVEANPTFSAENPRVLFTGNYVGFNANYPSYDISPDGQRFLMIKDTDQPDQPDQVARLTQLIVVYNWFEELNRLAPPAE